MKKVKEVVGKRREQDNKPKKKKLKRLRLRGLRKKLKPQPKRSPPLL
jgi:hypothetical protein